jgi:predicted DCC family thiol-disulfide oxidoreductase YuxK
MADDGPILFFDGVCNLCNGAVQFVIDRDPDAHIRFASLQSEAARRMLPPHGVDPADLDTVALLANGVVHTRSTAALRLLGMLRGPWRLAAALRIIPRPLRDLVYDAVARSRYRVFGRTDECRVPTPALRARFLEA